MKIEMGDCDGCPDYQRRIEVYSNNNQGCPAGEFFVEEEEPEVPEDTDPDETEETPGPEDESSVYLKVTSAIASTMAVLMIEF